MTYDPAQPIDIIFNSINDLVEYARAVKAELSQSQTVNLARVILHRQQIFKDIIRAWKRTNAAYKTWDNFNHDFREARPELRETDRTIDKIVFHNTYAIVDKMMVPLQIDEGECTATATQDVT